MSLKKQLKKSDNSSLQKIAFFNEKRIRKTWFKEEWWFSVVDIIEALTDSTIPKGIGRI